MGDTGWLQRSWEETGVLAALSGIRKNFLAPVQLSWALQDDTVLFSGGEKAVKPVNLERGRPRSWERGRGQLAVAGMCEGSWGS